MTFGAEVLWRLPAETAIGERRDAAKTRAPLPYVELADARASGNLVVTNERTVAETSSNAYAFALAEVVRSAAAASPGERETVVDRWLDASFDLAAARARLSRFRAMTRFAGVLSNLVPVVLIGGLAGIFYVPAIGVRWPIVVWLAGGIFFLLWIEMFRVHRELYPELTAKRWMSMLLTMVSLPAAARVRGWLGRDVLAGFHPLTAAAAILPRPEFEAYAAEVWRDLCHPLPVDAAAAEDVRSMQTKLQIRVGALLSTMGIDPAVYARPPTTASDRVRAYCPRCRAEFEQVITECPDCPAISVEPVSAGR